MSADSLVAQTLSALADAKRRAETPAETSRTPATARARLSTRPGSGGVRGQLDRITAWTQTHLGRAAFLPAADATAVAAAQQWGKLWPQELLELFTHADGSQLQILPVHDLLPLDGSNDIRRLWLDTMTDLRERHPEMAAAFNPEVSAAMPAGTPAGIFLPQFVPIADLAATTLFIDTRPGELFGCVTEYTDEGADDEGPLWISLAAMLTDLADSLETGTEFLRYQPSAEAGELVWERASRQR
ncbi:hypothetical protein [Nocardia sp. NPDC051570]|uniref:hypothetical protein n=1 Tax=Nocardia sp. NPDC051570 TaxID=3364324 RepID=UPI00378EEE2D